VTSPISSAVHQPPLPYVGGYPAATPYRLHSKLRRMAAGFHPEAIKRRQARYKLGSGDRARADPLRSEPRASGDEYAGRVHAKKPGPQITQGGENEGKAALMVLRHSNTRRLQKLHISGLF
jgi:hypothetical protein